LAENLPFVEISDGNQHYLRQQSICKIAKKYWLFGVTLKKKNPALKNNNKKN
jgi:hypothetical protein